MFIVCIEGSLFFEFSATSMRIAYWGCGAVQEGRDKPGIKTLLEPENKYV
jgi:hypothetical protein